MRKITALILCLLMLLAAAGCTADKETAESGIKEPKADIQGEPPDNKLKAPEAEEPEKDTGEFKTLGSVIQGVYLREIEQSAEPEMKELLEIEIYGEMILIEHSLVLGESFELYDSWAEEFWPDFPGMLNDDYSSIEGKSQCYSAMAAAGNFQDVPAFKTLSLEGDRLFISDMQGNNTAYTRSDIPGIHSGTAELMEILAALYSRVHIPQIEAQWLCQSGSSTLWLDIRQDGSFSYAEKAAGKPSCVLKGVWCYNDESENLEILAERKGWLSMPLRYSLWWNIDEGGNLCLRENSENDLEILENETIFMPLEGNWSLNPYNRIPFGYAVDLYNVSGSYEDPWGQEFTYSYKIPWILGYTPEIEELNSKINESFVQAADSSLEKIEMNETAELYEIDWESSIYENLLFITVRLGYIYEFEDYAVFCYDLQQDRLINTAEILEQLGISEAEFLSAVKKAAEEFYFESSCDLPDYIKESEEYRSQLEWTLSEDNINTGLMICIDPEGRLAALTPVGSIAGADWYYQILYPDLGRNFY